METGCIDTEVHSPAPILSNIRRDRSTKYALPRAFINCPFSCVVLNSNPQTIFIFLAIQSRLCPCSQHTEHIHLQLLRLHLFILSSLHPAATANEPCCTHPRTSTPHSNNPILVVAIPKKKSPACTFRHLVLKPRPFLFLALPHSLPLGSTTTLTRAMLVFLFFICLAPILFVRKQIVAHFFLFKTRS